MAGIVVTAITSPILIYSTSGGSLDISRGLVAPGDTYMDSRFRSGFGMGTNAVSYYIGQTRVLFGFLITLVLPIGALRWSRLKFSWKVGVIGAGFAHVLESASVGVNKGIADVIILLPWLILMGYSQNLTGRRIRALFITFASAIVALFVFASYFTANINQRMNENRLGHFDDVRGQHIVLLEPFESADLNTAFAPIIAYTTQGYYGLARSLELPFKWTYGIGNSMIWTVYAEKYFTGVDSIASTNYPRRVELAYGWDARIRWASAYPWLAGDVTFAGALIVIFLVGRLLATTWRDAMEAGNVFAANVFVYLIIGVHYLSANNQLMQVDETVLGVWIALLAWWFTRSASRDTARASNSARPKRRLVSAQRSVR